MARVLPRGVVPDTPGPGQESVWDYPRPPVLRQVQAHVVVVLGGVLVCDVEEAVQVLETSHPPTWYLPGEGFRPGALVESERSTYCEFKGEAQYCHVRAGDAFVEDAAWFYPRPRRGYEALAGHVSLYPGRFDEVTVNGTQVQPQPGGFYGGWITPDVVGPFKGAPGSWGW